MIEIWMKNHLVSGMNHNIVDLPCPMAKMLGLHLVYVTTTLYYLLFLATTKNGITYLQCCNYCHLLTNFSSQIQLSMIVLVTYSSCVSHKNYYGDIKYYILLNTIFSVVRIS